MTQETGQHGLMDLSTFKRKKLFSTALQIACSAVFLLYFLGETFVYFLFACLGVYISENTVDSSTLKEYAQAFFLLGFPCIIIANIIFAISFITSFFLKYSRKLRTIIKYILKLSTIFTSIAGLGWVCELISTLFSEKTSSKIFNDWFSYLLLLVFFLYSIILFLRPCYFRYFIFYHTPIVRQHKFLWLNIVPSGILFTCLYFISLYIMAIINKTL